MAQLFRLAGTLAHRGANSEDRNPRADGRRIAGGLDFVRLLPRSVELFRISEFGLLSGFGDANLGFNRRSARADARSTGGQQLRTPERVILIARRVSARLQSSESRAAVANVSDRHKKSVARCRPMSYYLTSFHEFWDQVAADQDVPGATY